ncbi:RimJ/RimL family protein N-acetyltransferase [Bacillus mesophilus]|uniref:GNAT family N-acetyltransferase n=1 Tax=Bacillus mesophilus TaxID=1808955 RepID=A0A6M0Q562_9BACI|nr:GNAT family N-acetyltransferase [Bacillus mesophilus]MBM7660952.1 RimJ/RimL family protein N-acetyltransferase [Bacillus mesophilus]NEY71505.1 GNAT family N-acetyltransferase [Bacillus mesophilus]
MIILETERLYLRPFIQDDINTLYSIFSDDETMLYYPAPFNLEQTQKWIEKNQHRYDIDGYGLWGVCLKETEELIGDCGLIKQYVDGKTEVEIGYHINKNYWSKGFATEAARACKTYGYDQLDLNRLISIINPKNTPSIRVAEKIEFNLEKESVIFDKTHFIYAGKKT